MKLVLAAAAARDLDDAAAWYESKKPGLGLEFLAAVRERCTQLLETPSRFPSVGGDLRRALLRRFPYCVLYRVDSDRLVLVAVLHAHRDPDLAVRRHDGD